MYSEVELFLQRYPDITMVEALMTDINGIARGKWLPANKLPDIIKSGLKMPQSALALDIWGFDVSELALKNGDEDGNCVVVPHSLSPIMGESGVDHAQLIMTMETKDGKPFLGDPRQVLQCIVNEFKSMGLYPCVAGELEFTLVPDPGEGKPLQKSILASAEGNGNLYALSELDKLKPMLEALREYFLVQDLPYEGIIKEYAPCQFEINMGHGAEVMELADQIICMQRGIQVVANRFGYIASFMPKPMENVAGNGMHIHCSMLNKDGENVFSNGSEQGSQMLLHAVGGVIEVMADTMLIFAPSFNGYRRFQSGNHAPTFPAWGYDNRTTAIRIPAGPPSATRIEHRVAGADSNPYLAIAAILAGVLHGIKNQVTPPRPIEGNAYDQEPDETPLPTLMGEAITEFEESPFVSELMGPLFQEMYSAVKQQELDVFQRRITEFELESYFRA